MYFTVLNSRQLLKIQQNPYASTLFSCRIEYQEIERKMCVLDDGKGLFRCEEMKDFVTNVLFHELLKSVLRIYIPAKEMARMRICASVSIIKRLETTTNIGRILYTVI